MPHDLAKDDASAGSTWTPLSKLLTSTTMPGAVPGLNVIGKLNPLHPRADGDAVAAGFKKRFPFSPTVMRWPQGSKSDFLSVVPIIDFDFASDQMIPTLSVASDSLVIPPPCPYCSNKRWAFDNDCGNIFCIGDEGRYTCPWCGGSDDYAMTDESFDVQRRMG
jgi:hypothetical protein